MVLQRGVSDFYRTYTHHIEKRKLYYFIIFDKNNKAEKVVIGGQPGVD